MINLEVVRTTKQVCDEFVSKKHYSRRPSIFWHGFALIENGVIEGVCVFGQPSPAIQKYAFEDRNFKLLELSRLVVQTDTKNASSWFVSKALKLLETPCAIVSYADSEQNHCGFIYQATNWLYTGATVSHDNMYIVDGKRVHPMTLRERGITSPVKWANENEIEKVKPMPKHRYFYLLGSKSEKKKMLSSLRYDVVSEYPKQDPVRYDDGDRIQMAVSSTDVPL